MCDWHLLQGMGRVFSLHRRDAHDALQGLLQDSDELPATLPEQLPAPAVASQASTGAGGATSKAKAAPAVDSSANIPAAQQGRLTAVSPTAPVTAIPLAPRQTAIMVKHASLVQRRPAGSSQQQELAPAAGATAKQLLRSMSAERTSTLGLWAPPAEACPASTLLALPAVVEDEQQPDEVSGCHCAKDCQPSQLFTQPGPGTGSHNHILQTGICMVSKKAIDLRYKIECCPATYTAS